MDDDISKAIEFLVHSAGDIGRAKERAVKADKMIGHIEALMSKARDGAAPMSATPYSAPACRRSILP